MKEELKKNENKPNILPYIESAAEVLEEGSTLVGNAINILTVENLISDSSTNSSLASLASDYLGDFCPFLAVLELNSNHRLHHEKETRIKRSLIFAVSILDSLSSTNNLLWDYGNKSLIFLSSFNLLSQCIVAGFDFALAAYNLHNARKGLNFEYWLDESILTANYITLQIEKLQQKIRNNEDSNSQELSKQLDTLIKNRKELLDAIESRCRVYYHAPCKAEDQKQESEVQNERQIILEKKLQLLKINEPSEDLSLTNLNLFDDEISEEIMVAKDETILNDQSKLVELDTESKTNLSERQETQEESENGLSVNKVSLNNKSKMLGTQRKEKSSSSNSLTLKHCINYQRPPNDIDRYKDQTIQQDLRNHYFDCQSKFFIKGLIFTTIVVLLATTLFCCPFLITAIVGGLFCYGGGVFYLGYNGHKGFKAVTEKNKQVNASSFFNLSNNSADTHQKKNRPIPDFCEKLQCSI